MTELLLDILGTWARAGAVALTVYLVEHHVVTGDQGDRLSKELITHITLILPAALALVWGTLKNIWQKRAVLAALWLPHGSTYDDLRIVLKAGVTPTVFTPADTPPGVPLPSTNQGEKQP